MEANFDYKRIIADLVSRDITIDIMAKQLDITLGYLQILSQGRIPTPLQNQHHYLERIQNYLTDLNENTTVPGEGTVEEKVAGKTDGGLERKTGARDIVTLNKSGASGPKRSKNRKPQQVVILEGYRVDPEAVKRARENESVWLFNQRTPEGKTQDFHNLNLDS